MEKDHMQRASFTTFLISLLLLATCATFFFLATFAPKSPVEKIDALTQVKELYSFTSRTAQSYKLGNKLNAIVRDRVSCYGNSPVDRLTNCNEKYIVDIVRTGRDSIVSAPDMGLFIENVRTCPIVYSVCMGDIHNQEECIVLEARCIDGMFDEHWRGRPFPTPSRGEADLNGVNMAEMYPSQKPLPSK